MGLPPPRPGMVPPGIPVPRLAGPPPMGAPIPGTQPPRPTGSIPAVPPPMTAT